MLNLRQKEDFIEKTFANCYKIYNFAIVTINKQENSKTRKNYDK